LHPLIILGIAIAMVLIGILVLRLHAFLALLMAAMTVAFLTPPDAIKRASLQKPRVTVKSETAEGVKLALGPKEVRTGAHLIVLRPSEAAALEEIGELEVVQFDESFNENGEKSVEAVAEWVGDESTETNKPKYEESDWVVHPHDIATANANAAATAPQRVAVGFGATCKGIGILIAMASIIGICLLDSGSADRIVRFTLKMVGQARAPIAFVLSGFTLGIPVFFDTVFYLMIPLGKAMRLRTGKHYLLYILTIVAGGTMAHSLVPPTPGPLFVAAELNVDLITMIIAGVAVGSVAAISGYLWALWIDRRMEIPLRDSAEFSLAELEKVSSADESTLPPVWLALTPIVLPVILIALGTGFKTYLGNVGDAAPNWVTELNPTVQLLGDKNVALMLAAAVALVTLAWVKRDRLKELSTGVQGALASGGVIILITAAGGAFGASVRQSGVAEEIANLTGNTTSIWILPVAFLVTTLVRSAQGSATVAMITAVSLFDYLAEPGALQFHPVYLALAIGCGSKPIAWMADSGFWVICKMSGMTEKEALMTVTPMSIIMGVTGLIATILGAWLLPMPLV